MTTANTTITKADTAPGILAQFQTNVTDVVNAASKWSTDSTDPFLGNYPLGGYYVSGTNFGGADPLAAGQTISSVPDAGSLPDARVVALEVENALRNACVTLSRARQINLQKYYYDAVFNLILWADFGVVLANLAAAQAGIGSFSTGLTTNTAVNAGSLDSYVTTLDGQLAAVRTSTAVYQEYWCHAACHASHSSRNRR